MDVVILIGRILFVLVFFGSAMGHLTQTASMAEYAKSRGVPAPSAAVVASGILMLIGGLSVLLGIWADLGALLLVVFLVPTAVLMHAFWSETDAQAKQMEQIQFMKDMSLAGAALMVFAFVAGTEDLGLMITDPLFSF
ncbi:DoxX family protein [Haloechinothrix halophila]|uniref:Putative membrane protein n=1 Tax=Haloechinothrix halophila YIM 93223 TaxID=592678 RepID=W9DRK0_9PSEU|nr:DoxX family protein [Haloechinothrix halophila]ETA66287.1 putative membrane protein [Haloechinothrix halophila YIM 93223]